MELLRRLFLSFMDLEISFAFPFLYSIGKKIYKWLVNDFENNIITLSPLSGNPTKWSNTQTIRRQIVDELFECVWPFCGIGA